VLERREAAISISMTQAGKETKTKLLKEETADSKQNFTWVKSFGLMRKKNLRWQKALEHTTQKDCTRALIY
jgi:hypothetical protein